MAGGKETVELLRQKARPFLFSSAATPADVAACIEAVKLLRESDSKVKILWENARYFKTQMQTKGFDVGKSQTPIVPVMIGDEKLTVEFSKKLFENGIFAVAITYPTVALGKARIRVMISAAHTKLHLQTAVKTFTKIGKELVLIG